MKKIISLIVIVLTFALVCVFATGCDDENATTTNNIPGIGSTSATTGTADTTTDTADTTTGTADLSAVPVGFRKAMFFRDVSPCKRPSSSRSACQS